MRNKRYSGFHYFGIFMGVFGIVLGVVSVAIVPISAAFWVIMAASVIMAGCGAEMVRFSRQQIQQAYPDAKLSLFHYRDWIYVGRHRGQPSV